MTENLIAVKALAEKHGVRRQTIFKIIKRLGIEQSRSRGGNESRGLIISYISEVDVRLVSEALLPNSTSRRDEEVGEIESAEASLYDVGVFYLLCLEPEHDPS